jgi:alpha-2-macroglobulin
MCVDCTRMKKAVAALLFLIAAPSLSAANLRIVSAGPVGTIATLAEANEVRVLFSEPMVAVAKIPQPVTAPFFHIEPAVQGLFRWSGTTTLIFTPDKPLPYATEFAVSVDASAKSISGHTLDQPYRWTFTTPTIKLIATDWYRKDNGALVIGLRFNQPVEASVVTPHLHLATVTRGFTLEAMPEAGVERLKKLEPQALHAFEAKRAKAQANANSNGQTIFSFFATEWKKERLRPGSDLIVLETKPGIPTGSAILVTLDEQLAASPGHVRSGSTQTYTIEVEPTFFVNSIYCVEECDPESRNSIEFRIGGGVRFDNVRKAVTLTDITDPAHEVAVKLKKVTTEYDYPNSSYSLDELGYTVAPGHRYAVRVDPSLTAEDGQKLGYTWMAVVDYWHQSAFVSFGSGHGVWESDGGPILPFSVRNFRSVKQWLAPLKLEQLMPIMQQLRTSGFNVPPPDAKPSTRTLNLPPDQIAAVGFDLKPAIGADNRGIVWAAVEPGDEMPKSKVYDRNVVATLVQSTNLGISVKDSPLNTLVMVTRLDDAKPVEGAKVTIRDRGNKVFWTGTTDANGIAIALNTDLRRKKKADKKPNEEEYDDSWSALSELHFLVTAEKDGDVAYIGSDWNDGISPWAFNVSFNLNEAEPQLRGTVFADRGVYKLGEEVHLKAIARADTPNGMQLLAPGTQLHVEIRDSQNRNVFEKTVAVNAWSSAELTFKLPQESPLGTYGIVASTTTQTGTIGGDFLVAAYRRPDFRVDVTLDGNSTVAGTKLTGKIAGRYLFGAPMSGKPLSWTYSKTRMTDVPDKITDRWPEDRYAFLGRDEEDESGDIASIAQKEEALDAKGELTLKLDTGREAGQPFEYQLEGVVTDVTRQEIAGRASFRVDPAPWYIGVRRPPYFSDAQKGVDTEIVAAGLDGLAVNGVNVKVELKRIQWTSARQAEGDGFYDWQSERKEVEAGHWTVTTKTEPVPLHIPIAEGGEYVLIARAEDGQGRSTTTRQWFYAVGEGYTAWERYDHMRIDLVPEKTTYKPGDTARIMIKSPWEHATALLTTEREGVRTWKPFELTSTQQTITVPITEKDIPNVFVSVLLIKGRTKKDPGKDGSDPGKPALRLGYVELAVEDSSKRLQVDVHANRDEFRPATKAKIEVTVKDRAGQPSPSEVTLWAVDYGVLSLTGYETPDVLGHIYLQKALQVANEDSRENIVSRRVITPKGGGEGGGGGRDAGPGTLRKDFRVLAFWLGSLTTDAKGHARTEVTLPESLTTYRIMAVAGDKQSRFGWAQNEIRINKPLMLTPSLPRFLAVGDKAHFGGVVHNQSKQGGKATVSIESLDPNVLDIKGSQTIDAKPNAPVEVRFDGEAKAIGDARIRMRVQMGRENDAFEEVIPVRVMVTPETFAAYGEAKPHAEEKLEIPKDVVPNFGSLRIDLASTQLVGLGEGAQYLIEYPYGCAEQRSSRALGLMLAGDLGAAFNLSGIDAPKAKSLAQETLADLGRFQCGDGGFAFWAGDCSMSSPYLTSYVLHVLQRGQKLGYRVDADMLSRAYTYLDGKLGEPKPQNEGFMPAYTAWQSFATKVLAEGGRNVDSHLNRLYAYRDRMPLFGIAYLLDAMQAKKEGGERAADLHRHLTNAILPEGATAHVGELADPYLLWFWNSNVRSTAIVLGTLTRGGQDEELVKRMVRWMMQVRKDGRWGNTQENAWALEAFVDYYRKYESETPDFLATVALGGEKLASETFKGRSTDARTKAWSMADVLKRPGGTVTFDKQGAGTLFYMMRLRYAPSAMRLDAMDQGFRVERSYRVHGGDASATSFKAGDLIEVTLHLRNTKERRFVAVTDPIPAGTEPVETWFATTASALVEAQQNNEGSSWWMWWERGGWDHVERHDDRVNLFATRLGEGDSFFTYLVRATTAGTFVTAPTHAEEMYEPEVFGRTATTTIEVKK